jgi:hypothetical protein
VTRARLRTEQNGTTTDPLVSQVSGSARLPLVQKETFKPVDFLTRYQTPYLPSLIPCTSIRPFNLLHTGSWHTNGIAITCNADITAVTVSSMRGREVSVELQLESGEVLPEVVGQNGTVYVVAQAGKTFSIVVKTLNESSHTTSVRSCPTSCAVAYRWPC